jgi:integrase
MPRQLRSTKLDTRTARLKLPQQPKPYWQSVAPGIALGYRRNAGPGSWSVRAADGKGGNWIKQLALADDQEDSDGSTVMTFSEAADRAKALARGQKAEAGRPATVEEALADYAADLAICGGRSTNASQPLSHLPASLLAVPVALLRVRDLRNWRNDLLKTMKESSANRLSKSLKAALNLAAQNDERIANKAAWKIGLAKIPEPENTKSNIVLTDEQVRDVVAGCYEIDGGLGLWIELHAATGARSSQIAELNVGDLETGAAPLLRMPSSLKGSKGRRTRTRKPMPISLGLAAKLMQAAAGRDAREPLLLRNGKRWSSADHGDSFAEAARAAELPEGATVYCLRHTVITRLLLANVPVRLVASSLNTSVAEIERTYSTNISNHGDDLMRRALADVGAPAESNVIAMRR